MSTINDLTSQDNYCNKCKSSTCRHSKYHVCQLHSDFKQKIYRNEIAEFLLLKNRESPITDICNEKCIDEITGKYQELVQYLDNRKFYYRSLKPQDNGFFHCPIDLQTFENYMEGRVIPQDIGTIERVEESIKFKLKDGKIYLNKDLTENQKKEMYGIKYTTGSFPSFNEKTQVYEINQSTPILNPTQ